MLFYCKKLNQLNILNVDGELTGGGPIYYSHGTSAARCTAILIKRKTNIKINKLHRDKEGRCIARDILHEKQ